MKLNEILGTRYPFIQGGMANIATGEFVAAVSKKPHRQALWCKSHADESRGG